MKSGFQLGVKYGLRCHLGCDPGVSTQPWEKFSVSPKGKCVHLRIRLAAHIGRSTQSCCWVKMICIKEYRDFHCVLPVVRIPGRERRLLETMQLATGEFITDSSQGLPPSPRVWGRKGPKPQFSQVFIGYNYWRKQIGYTVARQFLLAQSFVGFQLSPDRFPFSC